MEDFFVKFVFGVLVVAFVGAAVLFLSGCAAHAMGDWRTNVTHANLPMTDAEWRAGKIRECRAAGGWVINVTQSRVCCRLRPLPAMNKR